MLGVTITYIAWVILPFALVLGGLSIYLIFLTIKLLHRLIKALDIYISKNTN